MISGLLSIFSSKAGLPNLIGEESVLSYWVPWEVFSMFLTLGRDGSGYIHYSSSLLTLLQIYIHLVTHIGPFLLLPGAELPWKVALVIFQVRRQVSGS